MSKKVLLIGAGGVAGVAAAKMAQNPDVFGELLIASRTEARCKAIKADIEGRYAAGNGRWGTGNGERTFRPRRSTRWTPRASSR